MNKINFEERYKTVIKKDEDNFYSVFLQNTKTGNEILLSNLLEHKEAIEMFYNIHFTLWAIDELNKK